MRRRKLRRGLPDAFSAHGCRSGTIPLAPVHWAVETPARSRPGGGTPMNGIIYLIGLIVVIMAILSFLGLR